MNDQRGLPPGSGSVVQLDPNDRIPSTGLRDVVFALPQADAKQVDLNEILRVVTKWWWLILAILFGCLLAALALSLIVDPEYRAVTTLEINPEGDPAMQFGERQPLPIQDREFINTQAGLLRSRALTERVVRSLDLGDNPAIVPPDFAGDKDAHAADVLQAGVLVEPVRDSRLIEVSVESTDPALAARIANAYGESFIRSNLERRFESTSYARNFLEQRLATMKDRLEDSERQLVAYAQRQGIINIPTGSGATAGEQPLDAATLVSLNEALSQARAKRVEAEQRYRQTTSSRASSEVVNNPTVQALATQRAQLESEYQEKLGVFRPEYPQMVQLRSRIEALDRSIAQASGRVSGASSDQLRSEYAAAVGQENALQARVNQMKSGLLNLRGRSIQYNILQREVDTNRGLYDALLQRYKEVGVAGGVGVSIVSVADPALTPEVPFKPNLPLNMAIALGLGLVLGLGTAFALEWMDDTIKNPDDVTSKLGIPSLGVIPALSKGATIERELVDSRSHISEAYQSVRTSLQFSTEHGMPKSLLITSTRPAEGKSSSALAIAHSIASLGGAVLLIDADLRKPTFPGPSDGANGLSNLLAGSNDLQRCIYPTGIGKLSLLPAGKIPPNPAELLGSGRFASILQELSGQFDCIIVDGPPVLGLADAPLLASYCESTIMVVQAGSIRRAAVLNSIRRLRGANANIMGAILTKYTVARSGYGYGYEYSGEYAYNEGDKPKAQIELVKSA